jgi:hypothetical protein
MTQLYAGMGLDHGTDFAVIVIGGAILAARCRLLPFTWPGSGRREQRGDSSGPGHRHVLRPAHSGRLLGQRAGARADLSAGR